MTFVEIMPFLVTPVGGLLIGLFMLWVHSREHKARRPPSDLDHTPNDHRLRPARGGPRQVGRRGPAPPQGPPGRASGR